MAKLQAVSWSVLAAPAGGHLSKPDMLQNTLLFIPFGLLGMAVLAPCRKLIWAMVLTTVAGCALSFVMEAMQLFTTDRTSSLNDVATNTSGALIGALLAPFALVLGRRVLNVFSHAGLLVPSIYPALIALIVLCTAAWHPFDPTLDVGSVWSRAKSFLMDPWQQGSFGDEGVDAVRYALFAAAVALWLRDVGVRHARWVGALLGIAMTCALEASQLIMDSRMPGLKDMTMGISGAVAGAWMAGWARSLSVRARSTIVIIVAWLASAVMILTPFDFAPSRRPLDLMPFLNYYERTSGQTVSHVIELMLAFFPIGYALACAMKSRARWIWLAVVSFLLALPLEYLQGWIVGRYDDLTDPVVLLLGALAGAWIADYIASLEQRLGTLGSARRRTAAEVAPIP